MPRTRWSHRFLVAICLALLLRSGHLQPLSADGETSVDCRIRLIGQPGANEQSPGVAVISITCTGPGAPITITTNPALLSAVRRGSVRGADLVDGGPGAPFLTFRFQNGLTIRDAEIDGLAGGGDAPIVFEGSTARIVDSFFDRNSVAQAAVMHLSRSVITIRNSSFRSNVGNRYGVLAANEGTSLTILDSVFLGNKGGQNGDGELTSGAVMASATASLTVENTTFRGNSGFGKGASAFLALKTVGANFTNNDFFMNTAENGGAIFVGDGEQPLLSGCAFRDNSGGLGGGAVHLENTTGTFVLGCEFFDNIGAMGALLSFGSGLEVIASVFRFNTVTGFGGAVATFGEPVDDGTHSFARCIFQDNGAAVGGAIAQEMASETLIDGCVFLQNNATAVGGALYQWNCKATSIVNSEFLDNTARLGGGALSQGSCGRWSASSQDDVLLEDCVAEQDSSCEEVTLLDNKFLRNFANMRGGNLFQRGCMDVNLTSNRFQYTPFFAVQGRALYQQLCEKLTMEDNEFEAVDIEPDNGPSGKVIVRKECPV